MAICLYLQGGRRVLFKETSLSLDPQETGLSSCLKTRMSGDFPTTTADMRLLLARSWGFFLVNKSSNTLVGCPSILPLRIPYSRGARAARSVEHPTSTQVISPGSQVQALR